MLQYEVVRRAESCTPLPLKNGRDFVMAGKASEAKSGASKALLEKVFAEKTKGRQNFRLVYAYSVRRKLLTTRISNYVLAFKPEKKEILLIQIDSEGNTLADRMQLDRADIARAEPTVHGGWLIDAKDLKHPTEFFVPASMPDSAEITYQLPINQEELAAQFDAMMREISTAPEGK